MLGYMTKREALANGFTNHGKYYGIPLWVAPDGPDGMMVATKWAPAELLMTVFHVFEGVIRPVLFPEDEPVFQFMVGREIEPPH